MGFEENWKIKAIELAAREQLEQDINLDLKELFIRARVIHDIGVHAGIKNWGGSSVTPPPQENTPVPVPTSDGLKTCPKCGELIKEAWMQHTFKKDGKPCGYKWS